MNRITALVAAVSLVASVSVASAGGPIVVEGEQQIVTPVKKSGCNWACLVPVLLIPFAFDSGSH